MSHPTLPHILHVLAPRSLTSCPFLRDPSAHPAGFFGTLPHILHVLTPRSLSFHSPLLHSADTGWTRFPHSRQNKSGSDAGDSIRHTDPRRTVSVLQASAGTLPSHHGDRHRCRGRRHGKAPALTDGRGLGDNTAASTKALLGTALAEKNNLKVGSTFKALPRRLSAPYQYDGGPRRPARLRACRGGRWIPQRRSSRRRGRPARRCFPAGHVRRWAREGLPSRTFRATRRSSTFHM